MLCSVCGTENPNGMRFCGMCGRALAASYSKHERRYVTIAFIDLAGFTMLTRDFEPEETRDIANDVLSRVATVIESFDGYIDAFQGDGLIALFGAPYSHPDDPERAVRASVAALEMIKHIGRQKQLELSGRAGVNTGMVIAGSVGIGRSQDYTVMGSAVNLAARLEDVADADEVWVGDETYKATRHRLRYESTRNLTLRGFPDIRHAHKLVSDKTVVHDPYGHIDLVGREQELKHLRHSLTTLLHEPQAKRLWLVGEAGIGKSRLMKAFYQELSDTQQARVLWIGEAKWRLYDLWLSFAEQLFDHAGNTALEQHLSQLLNDHDDVWLGPVLQSIGLQETMPNVRYRAERRNRNRTAEAWARVLQKIAEKDKQALVLMIDQGRREADLLALVEALFQGSQSTLVIRSSRRRDFPKGEMAINLAGLSLAQSQVLLQKATQNDLEQLPLSLIEQTGGNPSYLLELSRSIGSTGTLTITQSLTSLMQARLDNLRQATRRLLTCAALTGEHCWEGLLLKLAGHEGSADVDALIDRGFLRQEEKSHVTGETELTFQSELLRQAAADMVPLSDRPNLHLIIASWLEQHADLDLSELIAKHFEQARLFEAAYPHYLAAAEQAIEEKRPGHAIMLYERLVEMDIDPLMKLEAALSYAELCLQYEDKTMAWTPLQHVTLLYKSLSPSQQAPYEEIYKSLRQTILTEASTVPE